MHVSLSDILGFEKRYRANFMNSLTGYRSLHLCGTQNDKGKSNLSVINSVFHIGSNPPLLGMMLRPDGANQDTLANIKSRGYFTLNQMPVSEAKKAHQSSARYLTSEFEAVGLKAYWHERFEVPFVYQSHIKYALKLEDIMPVSANGTYIIVGAIQFLEVDEKVIRKDGYVDLSAQGTLLVNGLDAYHTANPIARFAYAKPDEEVKEIAF